MERHGRSQHLATSQGSARPANLPDTHGASTQVVQHPQTYQQVHQQQQHDQVQRYLLNFWANQYQEIEQTTDFKNHSLPLARIKKIMKADEDVKMISAEAPVIFARACEIFILEMTLRSWNHTEENKRRTLQKNDIAAAVTTTDVFDFLVDIVPREDIKDEVFANMPRGNDMPATGLPDALPYYHMVTQHVLPVGAPGMMLGSTVMDQSVYGQQLCPYTGLHIWPHNQQLQQPPDKS